MMRLRVISPTDRTEDVIQLLLNNIATANLIVHGSAARDPEGDVVICDVARESANEVLDSLRAMGLAESGSIELDPVDISLSRGGTTAEERAPGFGGDAVVWDEIEQRTGDEARLSFTFVLFLSIATIIAGIGVLLDQPILIVGAMVVGPEFGPLAALCVGIIRRRPAIVGRSLLALGVGFLIAVTVTALVTLALDAFGLVDKSMLLAPRPLTDFIWRPDALSWVVGFLAGIAGMLSLTTSKSGALVGVLISVTTVPAAANVAVALAYGVPEEAAGSALQLSINVAAIVTAGLLTLVIQRLIPKLRRTGPKPSPTTMSP